MNFCALALVITEAKHSAMSTLLFCNRQDLLKGFTSEFDFLNVDRREGIKKHSLSLLSRYGCTFPKMFLDFTIL